MKAPGLVVAFAVAGGCYRPPSDAACTVTCATDPVTGDQPSCPGNLVCTSGVCTKSDGTCDGIGPDANVTITDGGEFCYGTAPPIGRVRICLSARPTNAVDYTINQVLDTADPLLCATYEQDTDPGHDLCVIVAAAIVINPAITVRFIGPRPVVLLGTNQLQIHGTLDVASTDRVTVGAGGQRAPCGGTAPSGRSGGAGGSGTDRGGVGGDGDGGLGGVPTNADATVALVRGGCPGQDGSVSQSNGGHGGGAVYLISGGTLRVTGTINASGAPGFGGSPGAGGGGAGAGGLIGFDAPIIEAMTGVVMANGGGGGCGGAQSTGGRGAAPDPADPNASADGCVMTPGEGMSGGAGSSVFNLGGSAGSSGANALGGGGGGGAAGAVRVAGELTGFGPKVSPPPGTF